jgi:hypothetical protein
MSGDYSALSIAWILKILSDVKPTLVIALSDEMTALL